MFSVELVCLFVIVSNITQNIRNKLQSLFEGVRDGKTNM